MEWEEQLRILADASEIIAERANVDMQDGTLSAKQAEQVRTAVHVLYIEAVGICIEQGIDLTTGRPEDRPKDLMRAYGAEAKAWGIWRVLSDREADEREGMRSCRTEGPDPSHIQRVRLDCGPHNGRRR